MSLPEGPLSELECTVLGEVAATSGASRALELGHFHGRSTAVLLSWLPEGCEFTTVDHHRGDYWAGATDPAEVRANVAPFVGERPFEFVDADMLEYEYGGPYDFVFYDADHTADAVKRWWTRVLPSLARECVLTFDDADWDEQSTLIGLAEAEGFTSIRELEFYRGQQDKNDPETYTLEVMRRVDP